MIYDYADRRLQTEGVFYIAPSADVIGSVSLGNEASIWFGAVLRGDNDWIHIGAGTNVQDGSIIHVDPGVPVILVAMDDRARRCDGCQIATTAYRNRATVLEYREDRPGSLIAAVP